MPRKKSKIEKSHIVQSLCYEARYVVLKVFYENDNDGSVKKTKKEKNIKNEPLAK
jgi:hypothetical protein